MASNYNSPPNKDTHSIRSRGRTHPNNRGNSLRQPRVQNFARQNTPRQNFPSIQHGATTHRATYSNETQPRFHNFDSHNEVANPRPCSTPTTRSTHHALEASLIVAWGETSPIAPIEQVHLRPIVPVRPLPPALNILTYISRGYGRFAPIQYVYPDILQNVSPNNKQNFAIDGWGEYWTLTFMPYFEHFGDAHIPNNIGRIDRLPPNFDISTWRIPSLMPQWHISPDETPTVEDGLYKRVLHEQHNSVTGSLYLHRSNSFDSIPDLEPIEPIGATGFDTDWHPQQDFGNSWLRGPNGYGGGFIPPPRPSLATQPLSGPRGSPERYSPRFGHRGRWYPHWNDSDDEWD